jgi:hypothetical protein
MSIAPIGSAPSIQAESQSSVIKAPVSPVSNTTHPAYTVSLSSAVHKATGGDVDHDGDSH